MQALNRNNSHHFSAIEHLEENLWGQARALVTELGLDPDCVPVGLIPLVNKRFSDFGLPPVGTALPALTGNSLQTGSVFGHINTQHTALVSAPSRALVPSFCARLCNAYPTSRVVLTLRNKQLAIQTLKLLRNEGHDVWFLDKEYRLHDGQAWPNHRVRIVLEDSVYLCSLDLHRADVVLIQDPGRFLLGSTCGFGNMVLFDQGFGTHFMENARLIGLQTEETPASSLRQVWQVFGMRNYQVNTQGEAFLAPRVTWITRAKQDRSHLNTKLTKESTNHEKLQAMVWGNLSRNMTLLRCARRLLHEAKSYAFVQERLSRGPFDPVAIVVANNRHKKTLLQLQEGKYPLIPVLSFEDVANRTRLPSFLMRGDAGTGLLPLLPQENSLWVVDVKDETNQFLTRRFRLRLKAYIRHWHPGEDPYGTKWLYRGL